MMRLIVRDIVNVLSMLLGNGRLSCKLRAVLFNLLGNDIPVLGRGRMLSGVEVLGGGLTVGEGGTINRGCYFDVSAAITIGRNVGIGPACIFITGNHELGPADCRAGPIKAKPIVIGDGVSIATRVTVLPGVTIGAGSVIGPCVLVRKSLPENSVLFD